MSGVAWLLQSLKPSLLWVLCPRLSLKKTTSQMFSCPGPKLPAGHWWVSWVCHMGKENIKKALALNAALPQTPHLKREDIHPIWEKSLSLKICRMDQPVRLAGTVARSAGTRFSLGAPLPLCSHGYSSLASGQGTQL